MTQSPLDLFAKLIADNPHADKETLKATFAEFAKRNPEIAEAIVEEMLEAREKLDPDGMRDAALRGKKAMVAYLRNWLGRAKQ